MKSIVDLFETCLSQVGLEHQVRTQRDLRTARSRIEHEGLSFLTITLPRFCKDLERAFANGAVTPALFVGFARSKSALPKFLGGFLECMFDVRGLLRTDVDPRLVRDVRQVLLVASKVELDVSDDRKSDAIRSYVRTDAELKPPPDDFLEGFQDVSNQLFGDLFRCVEQRLWKGDWRPRHSSGALATRESYNSRFAFATWTERLQSRLSWWDEVTPFPSELLNADVKILTPEQEPPVKVVLVPKTMKSPRIIAEEPVHMQYVQQGIHHLFVEELSSGRYGNIAPLFFWDSQEANRSLARKGSLDGSLATIDLSEASDRVHHLLARALFRRHRFLGDCVMAARSQKAQLPDGTVVPLNKFASMGSSLCFPIESMVFLTIAVMGMFGYETGNVVPRFNPHDLIDHVRVYGDDIIVPCDSAPSVIRLLETFGLKVNVDKTFTAGPFRESCGSDWFCGEDVSVFRQRLPFPESRHQYRHLRKTIELHNRAFGAGWFPVADMIRESLLRVTFVPSVPVGLDTPALWTYGEPTLVRYHHGLQRIQYRTLLFRQLKPSDVLDGYGALKKCLPLETFPRDRAHLSRDGRSQCVGVNTGWIFDWN